MGDFLYRYLVRDLYVPVWPNIAADVLAAGWTISRVKTHLHRHRALSAGHPVESRHQAARWAKRKFGGRHADVG